MNHECLVGVIHFVRPYIGSKLIESCIESYTLANVTKFPLHL